MVARKLCERLSLVGLLRLVGVAGRPVGTGGEVAGPRLVLWPAGLVRAPSTALGFLFGRHSADSIRTSLLPLLKLLLFNYF